MSYLFITFLANPIVFALSVFLVSAAVFGFWVPIVRLRKFYKSYFIFLFSAVNGICTFFVAYLKLWTTSPIIVSVVIPILLMLELYVMGYLTKWGELVKFFLSSFQFITLYMVSVGIINISSREAFLEIDTLRLTPITLLNIILAIFLSSLLLYRNKLNITRDMEIAMVLSSFKYSTVLFLFTMFNAVALTFLAYDTMYLLKNYVDIIAIDSICRNIIIRDTLLFFSTILILDIASRNLQNERMSNEAITKSIILEQQVQNQTYIQEGLEAARKKLEEENKELQTGLEYEQELRKRLHRNVLFRISANITTDEIIEYGALNIIDENNDGKITYADMILMLTNLLVHPDHQDELIEALSREHILSIADTDRGFNIPFRLSPGEFMNHVSLDDDAAKIYIYMDRDYIWTSLDCSIIRKDGNVFAYFYIMDVDEQKQQEETIRIAATTDALTGLLNRRAFVAELHEYMSSENGGGALFMFDLDYFKSVNDNLGHPKGDELLRDVARILKGTFRSNDLICRIGGDEFCAFAKGFTDERLIRDRAKALNLKGRQSFDTPSGGEIHVSFSLGIAVTPNDAEIAEELYKLADAALYNAKESGRDCFRLYSDL